MDERLKNDIKRKSIKSGCDWDGDIIWYCGKCYYIDISRDIVVEQPLTKGKER